MTHRNRFLIPLILPLLAPILSGFSLGACGFFEPPPQVRGNRIDADVLKELTPGTTSRADVMSLIGSPTAHATFNDNIWIYVGQITRMRVARTLGVEDQQVVVMTFNDAGVLQSLRTLNQDDALPVSVVARTTPSPGSEASILQQLIGSVGRYSPGAGSGASNSENANTK